LISQPKKLVLLGSTGSVGTSAIKVARKLPHEVEIVGLAGGSRVGELAQQAIQFGVKNVCIYDANKVAELRAALPADCKIFCGPEGLIELSTLAEADMVLLAIVGVAGLRPALAAIEAGKELAVASKEILVMAGEIVMNTAAKHGVCILPVDSEHNAIFQCLAERRPVQELKRVILTASGGPFRTLPSEQLQAVTVRMALAHPTWEMGKKISIDSATLFNKGLEMIEAKWLFNLPMEKVDVIIHPQSIIHSMVEYIDGSVIAQMNSADMCFPIQYAVTWPRRVDGGLKHLDFASLARLDFERPRFEDFPALSIAIEAGKCGGTAAAVMNAANEVAVAAFLQEKISFPAIWKTVESTLSRCESRSYSSIDDLIAADEEARRVAAENLFQ
jgi:1-deoxy-D-xylulose-5-phosphate reductoisomerase